VLLASVNSKHSEVENLSWPGDSSRAAASSLCIVFVRHPSRGDKYRVLQSVSDDMDHFEHLFKTLRTITCSSLLDCSGIRAPQDLVALPAGGMGHFK
jgi:hypothetical protein